MKLSVGFYIPQKILTFTKCHFVLSRLPVEWTMTLGWWRRGEVLVDTHLGVVFRGGLDFVMLVPVFRNWHIRTYLCLHFTEHFFFSSDLTVRRLRPAWFSSAWRRWSSRSPPELWLLLLLALSQVATITRQHFRLIICIELVELKNSIRWQDPNNNTDTETRCLVPPSSSTP